MEELDLTQTEQLEQLVDAGDYDQLKTALHDRDPADIADFIEELDEGDRSGVFRVLDNETAADVLAELGLSYHEDVLDEMASEDIADLAELMAPDDSADLLDGLDEDKTAEVLAAMEPEERLEVLPLLTFEEDSAGHIMTPEMCQVPPSFTVEQTRRMLASAAPTEDPIFFVYVADPTDQSLLGLVSLSDLVIANPDVKLGDICNRDYIFTTPQEDQEDVARKFRKYDIWVMPVIDEQNRLVGRITVDDVLDVVHEEADEDLARMIGAPDIETEEEAPGRIAMQRLPWLMITMFAGLVNSVIIKYMINTTGEGVIAIFVPAILAMGGNTGMQSSAIAVRGIALGLQKYSRLRQIVVREVSVGIIMGIACALLTGTVVYAVLSLTGADTGGVGHAALAISVGVAMGTAMIFASSFGAITPVVMHRMGIDPAVASGPFVTTSNDLSASFIYFLTVLLVLHLM